MTIGNGTELVKKVGIVGTGFIGRGLLLALAQQPDLSVSHVLTRRNIHTMANYPYADLLTNSVDELISHADVIVECSGDVLYGSDVVAQAMAVGLPVVTMNAELQVVTGSYFARRGMITEAEGDQPGCLAALHENAVQMGFKPLVYGNIKGFLNHNPTEDDMLYWSERNGISVNMTTSFTDGTKIQIEQALVANGLGATIARDGLLGIKTADADVADGGVSDGGTQLAREAERLGQAISDYVLAPKAPAGVFITATHDDAQSDALKYFKMGSGPYYTLLQTYHLCHLEIPKTIRRVLNGGTVLLNNSPAPTVSVAAVAKRDLSPGETIVRGIGSFAVRGSSVTIAEHRGHVPIGLLANAVVKRPVAAGQTLTFTDIDLPDDVSSSLALEAWLETEAQCLDAEPQPVQTF
ncbi:SAF domain-containing protein [Numidum massiliense]|uniref:SAF domain-containing protein n=1 Tax=Numidum massiliense TaxID=1522315 RepID=UPI0006D56174|nr:SAF domain-containing protein [Numidum massiliense]